MDIQQFQHCVSNDPYFTKYLLSESKAGVVYSVNIANPGDPPETWLCSCPGFQFQGHCKHINMVDLCKWDQRTGPEKQSPEQRKQHLCPRCGNDTSTYLIADESE